MILQVICGILLAIIILGIILFSISAYETRHLRLVSYVVLSDKIQREVEFLFLSDLHSTFYEKDGQGLLRLIEKSGCNTILIGGDVIVKKKSEDWTKVENFLVSLAGKYHIYYANGNHEQLVKERQDIFGKKYEQYKERLEKAGVIFLENTGASFENIDVYGLEIPMKYYKKKATKDYTLKQMQESIGVPGENFTILLAHNPRYMDVYMQWKPDLVLSGHFHGGVMRLPFVGGVISTQFDLFPRYSGGHYKIGESHAIVTLGAGTHSKQPRVFNRPELVKIKLQNKG